MVPFLPKSTIHKNPFLWELISGIEAGSRDNNLKIILAGSMMIPLIKLLWKIDKVDISAISLIKGLRELGLSVPEDISVVGFDDIYFCNYIVPALTSIRQDIGLRGKKAVALLMRQLYQDEVDEGQPRSFHLPVELIIRQSTTICHQ